MAVRRSWVRNGRSSRDGAGSEQLRSRSTSKGPMEGRRSTFKLGIDKILLEAGNEQTIAGSSTAITLRSQGQGPAGDKHRAVPFFAFHAPVQTLRLGGCCGGNCSNRPATGTSLLMTRRRGKGQPRTCLLRRALCRSARASARAQPGRQSPSPMPCAVPATIHPHVLYHHVPAPHAHVGGSCWFPLRPWI
jgi:hypothetical protein